MFRHAIMKILFSLRGLKVKYDNKYIPPTSRAANLNLHLFNVIIVKDRGTGVSSFI